MRKQPVKTATVKLSGDFEGWEFEARLNPPMSALADVSSGNFDRIIAGLSKIIRKWNFVDDDGQALPEPTPASIAELCSDAAIATAKAYAEEVSKLPPD